MKPEEPRLTVTEPGLREAKWVAKKPLLRAEAAPESQETLRASGLLAIDFSKTANIFFPNLSEKQNNKKW